MTPRRQLDEFIDRFSPEIARRARGVMGRLRRLLPGAVEMVYDNFYALVVGLGATERPSEAVVSVVMNPRYVSVCFINGVQLPDPEGRLQGGGNQVRHIRMGRAEDLDDPVVKALVAAAVKWEGAEFVKGKRGKVVIRAVAARRMARRREEGREGARSITAPRKRSKGK